MSMNPSPTNPDKPRFVSPTHERREWAAQMLRQAHAQGGMTLLVDGLPGMGKTFLLHDLRAAALAEGQWPLIVVRADEFEVGEPYSFIERVVAASGMDDWYFEPGSLTDPIDVARECIRRLLGDGKDGGWVFIVDDAQWVDAESHRVLRYVIPRITRRNMLLAIGSRSPHDSGSFGAFLKEFVSNSHLDQGRTLQPLASREVRALIAERYGVAVSKSIAKQIVAETGGSFLEIDSVLSSMTAQEIAQIHLGWSAPARLTEGSNDLLLRTYRDIDRETQATVELVSLAGHALNVDQIHAAARILNEPVHLDSGIAMGMLSQSEIDSSVMSRHTLLATAIANSVPQERAREIYHALAEVTEGYRSLRQRLMGASNWSEGLKREVTEYVAAAVSERKFGSAGEVLRAGLELVTEPEARIELIESLVLVHLQAKTGYLVVDLLDEITQFPPTLLRQLMVQVLSAHRVGAEVSPAAVQAILTTVPKTTDERAILGFYAFLVVLLSMRSADTEAVPTLIEHAKRLVAAAPSSPDELSDQRLAWMVDRDARLLVLDCYQVVQYQQRSELDEVRAALPGIMQRIEAVENSSLKVDAMVAIAGAQMAIGRADLAHAMAEEGVAMLKHVGEPWAAGTARVILGHCMILRGDLSEASELIDLAEAVTFNSLDVETRSSWAALQLTIAAMTGDENAELYVEQSRRHRDVDWEAYSPDLGVIAECEFARVRGNFEEILRVTSGSWVEQIRSTQHGFLTYRAQALIETQRLEEAAELIGSLARWRGERWQEYWGSLDWLQARLARAEHDEETARWHFESAITHREFPLPCGIALADFGGFLAESGDRAQSEKLLRSAVKVLTEINADGYLAAVREILETTLGVQEQAPAVARHLAMLTAREQQVVELVAGGGTNPQIAKSLDVSVTTVRSHISNILRKLNLNSRQEVIHLLSEEGHQ
ncbi:MAG: LuxR C-terminal-related transcriptional regulator [Gulosibacter sp.]|uniref:helix-turn-helix transcriptional regulator n=1 Tax=Gulosibacter sp. TaxID=2817531 RepID=UPI003F916FC1